MFFTKLADARHYLRWHQPRGRAKIVKCKRRHWTDHTMTEWVWEHGYTVVLK